MIKLVREPRVEPPIEACCFCRAITPYWTGKDGNAVACCQACGKTASRKDLPTKKEWCAKERAIFKAKWLKQGFYPCCGNPPFVGHGFGCDPRTRTAACPPAP